MRDRIWAPRAKTDSGPTPMVAPRSLAAHAVHHALSDGGRALDAEESSFAASAGGRGLEAVRVHAGGAATEATRMLGVNAFTHGQQIVVGHGWGGTRDRRQLIAHEVAHARQQGERPLPGPERALAKGEPDDAWEQQANRAAGNAAPQLSSDSRGAIACDESLSQRVANRLRQSLAETFKMDAADMLGAPGRNQSKLEQLIDSMGPESARVVQLLDQRWLENIAGSKAGVALLNRLLAQLPKGSKEAQVVEKALDARGSSPTSIPAAKVTQSSQEAIDRINRAVAVDPHIAEYGKTDPPLSLPVQLYSPGRTSDGGVYYDPNLDATQAPPERGETPTKLLGLTSAPAQKLWERQTRYPLVFIRLGPAALAHSDANVRSVLYHEFTHYKQYLAFRQEQGTKSEGIRAMEGEKLNAGGEAGDSMEAEANAAGISEYMTDLSDAEIMSKLLYLSLFLRKALPVFRDAAVERVRDKAEKTKQTSRLKRLIDKIQDPKQRQGLAPLRNALQ